MPLRAPRAWCALALVDGALYVSGGYGPGGALLASVERYNLQDGAWEEAGAMREGRAGHAMAVVPTNRGLKLCCVGGFVGESTGNMTCTADAIGYDEATGAWELERDFCLPEPLAGFALCTL
jgi:hypothetical protein